jgi:hypothetical protein
VGAKDLRRRGHSRRSLVHWRTVRRCWGPKVVNELNPRGVRETVGDSAKQWLGVMSI